MLFLELWSIFDCQHRIKAKNKTFAPFSQEHNLTLSTENNYGSSNNKTIRLAIGTIFFDNERMLPSKFFFDVQQTENNQKIKKDLIGQSTFSFTFHISQISDAIYLKKTVAQRKVKIFYDTTEKPFKTLKKFSFIEEQNFKNEKKNELNERLAFAP